MKKKVDPEIVQQCAYIFIVSVIGKSTMGC